MFQGLDLSEGEIPYYENLSHKKALQALLKGELDAMLFVAGKPIKLFSEISAADKKKLRDFHFAAIDANAFAGLPYIRADISSKDYPWLSGSTQTLAVKAQLISYDFSRSEKAYHKARCDQFNTVTSVLRDNIASMQKDAKKWHPKW